MKKVLFLIHDLGQGGAEKVLVNLVNNMDLNKFDITVMSLFGGGVNEQFLRPEIHYIKAFERMIRGNSYLMKILTPAQLHKWLIKDTYDIEISYLEGPSARIISGCQNKDTKLLCWIHSNHFSMNQVAAPFRSKKEAISVYNRFDLIVCVSKYMRDNFTSWIPVDQCIVLYNTVDSDLVLNKSKEEENEITDDENIRLIAVGSLKEVKGYDRLLRIIKRLCDENYPVHLYLLGKGKMQRELEQFVQENSLESHVSLLGYKTNPYKYVANCDLFVCSSYSEGFSTSVTEALIVGTPVCTVDVSGMREMLGDHNEFGIVTENNENALYEGIRELLSDKKALEHYKKQAAIRGQMFRMDRTIRAVEDVLISL